MCDSSVHAAEDGLPAARVPSVNGTDPIDVLGRFQADALYVLIISMVLLPAFPIRKT